MVTSVIKSVLQDMSSNADEPRDSDGESQPVALAHLPEETCADLVQLFKLLADDTRLRIMYFLMQQEELNVRTLCDLLRQSQPAVSHHLALLRVAGIIECRRDGKHNFYHLVPRRFQHFLDTLFNVHDGQPRRVRFDSASLTYAHDGEKPS
jgi:ArsR family transcriptional regulator, arsenate/arsenite/antimonite-responsive transcriptional repressor